MKGFNDFSKSISVMIGVGIFYYIFNFGYSLIKAHQYYSLGGASLFQKSSVLAVAPGCFFSFSPFDLIIPIVAIFVLLCVYRRCKYSAYLMGVILVIEGVFGGLMMSVSRLFRAIGMGIPPMCGLELFWESFNGIFPFALLSGLLFAIIKSKEFFQKNNQQRKY